MLEVYVVVLWAVLFVVVVVVVLGGGCGGGVLVGVVVIVQFSLCTCDAFDLPREKSSINWNYRIYVYIMSID